MRDQTNPTVMRGDRFTLSEIILVMIIGSFLIAGFVQFIVFFNRELGNLQAAADIRSEGSATVENFKYDISYSSLGEIVFWPSEQDAQGLSFPIIRRDDHSLPPLTDGAIAWTHTVAYYLYRNEHGIGEIRRTLFANRDNTLTRSARESQLENVIVKGNGAAAANGLNSTTRVLASQVNGFTVGTGSAIIDARESELGVKNVHIGSALLKPGRHTLRLVTVEDADMPQNVGIDSLYLSANQSHLEGECIPGDTMVTNYGNFSRETMPGVNRWSNNAQLLFTTTIPGSHIEFTITNDMWVEANFDHRSGQPDGTKPMVEPLSGENSVCLAGRQNAWNVFSQAGLGLKTRAGYDNSHIRLVINDYAATHERIAGARCKITLTGNCLDKDASVEAAFLMERASGASGVSNTLVEVTFNGGQKGVTIPPGTTVQSDWISLPYDSAKSYLLGLTLSPLSDDRFSSPLMLDTSQTGVYRIDRKYATLDFAKTVDWSEESLPAGATLWAYNECPLISSIFVSHPAKGSYVSRIFDTGVDAPNWENYWTTVTHCSGGGVTLKFRSGNLQNMSDAPSWDSVPALNATSHPSALTNLASGRYLQFRAELSTAAPYLETPYLRDLAITWTGQAKVVDMGGRFTHGPDYGKFMVLLDGEPVARKNAFMDFELERQVARQPVTQRFYVASDSHQVE